MAQFSRFAFLGSGAWTVWPAFDETAGAGDRVLAIRIVSRRGEVDEPVELPMDGQ